MIYYFLPDSGKFGGVKVGCQLVDSLNHLGFSAIIVTPDGRAPDWFHGRFAVLPDAVAMRRIGADDCMVITWPPDHRRLAHLPARKVCHVQGTDPLMDPLFADPDYLLLSCWQQADDYARDNHARGTTGVGISISEIFFQGTQIKNGNQVAYMPRRGHHLVTPAIRRCSDLDFVAIDELHESGVAACLDQAGYFLATALGEQFGLPALEAMAAGCIVLSVPVRGGIEYLDDGENCLLVDPGELASRLHWISRPERAALRVQIAQRARATAANYHPQRHLKRLRATLNAGLGEMLS
jgi:hypothetical protein